MVTMGLSSLIFASFMLYRRRDIKAAVRLFLDRAYGHHHLRLRHGRAAGEFRRVVAHDHAQPHQVAIFFAVGNIAQAKGTQKIADIRGLTESHPVLGWGLVVGVVAIAGLPPLGIFMSEFLVVTSTFARQPLLAIPLVLGLLVAFGALLWRVNGLAFGAASGPHRTGEGLLCADVRTPGAGAGCRPLLAAGAGSVVPARREAAGMTS
jgi:hydrogenase-4 component F